MRKNTLGGEARNPEMLQIHQGPKCKQHYKQSCILWGRGARSGTGRGLQIKDYCCMDASSQGLTRAPIHPAMRAGQGNAEKMTVISGFEAEICGWF